jgi:hypothetical protein
VEHILVQYPFARHFGTVASQIFRFKQWYTRRALTLSGSIEMHGFSSKHPGVDENPWLTLNPLGILSFL